MSPLSSGLLFLSSSIGDFRTLVFELPLCMGDLWLGDPHFCKVLYDPNFCSFPSDTTGLGLCGKFSQGDPETDSLFSQADSICYLAFLEDEAFRESELHISECYLACGVQFSEHFRGIGLLGRLSAKLIVWTVLLLFSPDFPVCNCM